MTIKPSVLLTQQSIHKTPMLVEMSAWGIGQLILKRIMMAISNGLAEGTRLQYRRYFADQHST